MKLRTRLVTTVAISLIAACPAMAQGLSGKVVGPDGAAMEGVVVSAKKGVVTVSVVSDKDGAFTFPKGRLDAGDYNISVRAAGFVLQGPKAASVAKDGDTNVDVKLGVTRNLTAQLTNQEWLMSLPGSDDQKRALTNCTSCHTVQRIMESSYNAEEFMDVIKRMAQYSNNSFFKKPQIRSEPRELSRFLSNPEQAAAYFASVNRSEGERTWPLKTMPRLTGESTKVVITEYDLPDQSIQPHDVMADPDGVVWHTDFSGQILGRFDTRTLKHSTYAIPLQRQGWPTGGLDIEPDPKGDLWVSLMFQAGAAKFDRATEKFSLIQLPPDVLKPDSQQAMVSPQHIDVDGKIWLQDPSRRGVYRMDLSSGATELYLPFGTGPGSPYSIFSDKQNNLWFLDFGGENIGRIDAKTGAIKLYPTPTKRSRPRRGRIDAQGRIWFAEFGSDRVGMFDTNTEQFKEWKVPNPFYAPYDAALDKEGNLWTGGMNSDRVTRINVESGKTVEYQLPRSTNVRRIFIDDSGPRPALWMGSNHGASIVKVEPQD
jgi:virginiamycin B lyase